MKSSVAYPVAQTVLAVLVGNQEATPLTVDVGQLAHWLIAHDLGPLACHRYKQVWPALTHLLQADYFTAVAEAAVLLDFLGRVLETLNQAHIPSVVLKGAAVASYAYPKWELRLMSDIDIWVGDAYIKQVEQLLTKMGLAQYQHSNTFERYGKLEMQAPSLVKGGVDIHAQMLAGYWLDATTQINDQQLWQSTCETTFKGHKTRILCAEDALIHAAVHVAINHKFDNTSLRTLTDIALLCRYPAIEWPKVVAHAQQWHIQSVLTFVLCFVQELFQLEFLDSVVQSLTPPPKLSRSFISPSKLIAGYDLSQSANYYLLQLLLADNFSGACRLLWNKLSGRKRPSDKKK